MSGKCDPVWGRRHAIWEDAPDGKRATREDGRHDARMPVKEGRISVALEQLARDGNALFEKSQRRRWESTITNR